MSKRDSKPVEGRYEFHDEGIKFHETRKIKGRGTAYNPPNRFEEISIEPDPDFDPVHDSRPKTRFLKDTSHTAIAYNSSPDVPFDASINPYRGCEHGCVYCYARPTHEYLGFSAGLDFETKIVVKEDAPELLSAELSSTKWKPQVLALSGVTDPYQPIEKKLGLTRRCLEVLAMFRNPVMVVTKNHLVTRDIDLLQELADANAAAVYISITTLDVELCNVMEPRTSRPERRLRAVDALSKAGIKTGVLVAPIIPGLTDSEIPSIIEKSAMAGAQFAGYVTLRLPLGVKHLFERWLEAHFPNKKGKVLNRVRELRGGRLNDPRFGSRMKGEGVFAEQIQSLFELSCRKAGIARVLPSLSTDSFTMPDRSDDKSQLSLFD